MKEPPVAVSVARAPLACRRQPPTVAPEATRGTVGPLKRSVSTVVPEATVATEEPQPMALVDTVEPEETVVPDTAERTPRPGSRPKQPRTEAPAETEDSAVSRHNPAATAATVAAPGTAATAETAATVSRPAINRLEPKAATPVREESVDPVERSEHSPVRRPATVVTVATPESLEMAVSPPQVATVVTAETVPLVVPVVPVVLATALEHLVEEVATAATPAMVVLPPPAERLLTSLTVVTVDLVVVGMPVVPPAQLVRLPVEP